VPHPVRLVAALLLAAAPLSAQQAERYTLSGTTIKLYNLIGTLEVTGAQGSTASAEVTRQGADGARLTVANDGGTLRIVYPGTEFVYPALGDNSKTTLRVREDGTFNGDDSDGGRGQRVTIVSRGSGLAAWAQVRLAIPPGVRAELNLGVGKVTLANVNGSIAVRTANGDISGNGTAGELSIDTGSGDVGLTGHDGSLSVDTGSGDITLAEVKGDALSLDTGSGDVRIDGMTTAKLSVDTGSGDVVLSGVNARALGIDTGSGDVRVGLTGDVDELSVDTGSGDVELRAPRSLGAMVTIETSSGDITTEFPLQVTKKSRDGLSGRIGDGRGQVSIETASGDVTLRELR
jgi:lia operon protein LiaG